MEMKENKIMQFGALSNTPLDWVVLDENDEDILLISVDPFASDNTEYLERFFKDQIINKYFTKEELSRIQEIRLFTVDEYEVYSKTHDLKTPYIWFLEQTLESYNGDVREIYYTLVNSINKNNNPDYLDTLDIIQSLKDGKVVATTNRDSKDVAWDYKLRPVIRISK